MTQPMVLAETSAVLNLLSAQPGPHLADVPPGDARSVYHMLGDLFDEPADPDIRTVDFKGPACGLRAYFPNAAAAGPVILYMHGGGWVIGDLETHNSLCALIARLSGLRVIAVDYRLAPEHPYPVAHDDCLAAARFVSASPPELEAPVTAIAVAGDSAGGNLALYVATRLGRGVVPAQMLFYPWLDCTGADEGSYHDLREGYLLDRRLLDRFRADYLPDAAHVSSIEASPLRHPLAPDLPPAIIVTAGLDPLRDKGRALAAGLAGQGGEVHFIEAAGLIHGMATMRKALPTGDRIVRRAITTFTAIIRAAIRTSEEYEA